MPKKSKWLLQSLVLSVLLNVALTALFFYFAVKGSSLFLSYAPKSEKVHGSLPCSNSFLAILEDSDFEELLERLKDDRKLEGGMAVRDFALSFLAENYYIDVARALDRVSLTKKTWVDHNKSFSLFTGLGDKEFVTIESFCREEKWPYTAKGLYHQIKERGIENIEPEAILLLCHTPEFLVLQALFSKQPVPLQKRELLYLILEGEYPLIENFHEKQKYACDLTEQKLLELLLAYLNAGSKTACSLLIKIHEDFVLNCLEPEMSMKILEGLNPEADSDRKFLKKVIDHSSYPLAVDVAKRRLSGVVRSELQPALAGKLTTTSPELKQLRPLFRDRPPASPSFQCHVVQPGESLWIIANKHHVKIEDLMRVNGLQSTLIQPGMTLRIPS